MFNRLKSLKVVRYLSKSFIKKIMTVTMAGLFICFFLNLVISNQGLSHLKNKSTIEIEAKSVENTQDLLASHLISHSKYLNYQIKHIAKTPIKDSSYPFDKAFDSLFKRVQEIEFSQNGFAFLSRTDGSLLAMEDSAKGLLKIQGNFKQSSNETIRDLNMNPSQDPSVQYFELNNKKYWLIVKKLDTIELQTSAGNKFKENWVLGFILPETDFSLPYELLKDSIIDNANDILLKQAAMMLVLFALITTILFFLYDKMSLNLKALIEATMRIKKRKFDEQINIDSDDEFGILAESFNDMTSEIKATVQQLVAQNELLKDEMGLKDRMDEQISFMKQYDTLTALPNKQTLYKKIDEYIRRSTNDQQIGALIIIGIDNFKKVNEAYGMECGDALLKEVAERLRNAANADAISRITGDEFGLIFYGLKVLDDLIPKLDYLRYILNNPFVINDKSIYLTASYGISTFPGDAISSKEILKNASTALIIAKENKADHYRFYDSNIEQNIKDKVEMMNALRKSIEEKELSLVYQPIVDAESGQLISVEALLRWHNPQLGYIPPSIFIPIAEEIHFISQIERFVVEQTMKDIGRLRENELSHVYISINLSAIDLDSDDFMDYLENQFKLHQIAYGNVQLEITEGVLIDHYESVVSRLNKLRKAGIHIALDDFGTGYSSLKYIKRLPIDCLKIDRSFVKDYPVYDDGGIAKIIINLARTFNLKVIAEGVETREQSDFLLDNGCPYQQGYLFGKGVSLEQLIRMYQLGDFTKKNL